MLNCYWVFEGVKHVRAKLHHWKSPHRIWHIHTSVRHHIRRGRTYHGTHHSLYKWVCTTGFAGAGAGGLGYAWWPSIADWYYGRGYSNGGYSGTGVIPAAYAATPVPEPNSLVILIIFIALFAIMRLAKKA